MHSFAFPRLARVVTVFAIATLAGCSVSSYIPRLPKKPVPAPQVETATVQETTEPAVTTALEPEQPATSPWDFIKLSRQAVGAQRLDYLLDAVEGFLDLSQDATARTLLESLEHEPLLPPQNQRRILLLARSHYLAGNYKQTDSLLRSLSDQPGLDRDTASAILLLRARAQSALSNPEAAMRLLVAREPFLADHQQIRENQDTIWRVLSLISVENLEQIKISSPVATLAKWAELALLSQRTGWNTHHMQQQFENWRQLNPAHPASRVLLPDLLANLGQVLTQYNNVALLLPLTSGYGSAAQAFLDGFSMMQTVDTNPRKPRVLVYDIGDQPGLASFYYQTAMRDGAELVIGPLGKQAVDVLVTEQTLQVPTLLLGNTDLAQPGARNVFQFGLSPEEEAREVARKAFADGHRIAAILYPEVDWGIRQVEAFNEQWLALGGEIAETGTYVEQRSDHTQSIKLLLNIDESETRQRELQRKLEVDLEFFPRKRQDLDFIFLVSRSTNGRLLKPQLNFHNASDIPVYSISQIYSASNDHVKDLDLDGVVFGDMPWVVLDSGASKYMRENLEAARKYQGQALDRLFALGVDTYQLLFRLEQMKQAPGLSFQGTTGQLKLRPDGVIGRELAWSRFVNGVPTALGWESALVE